MRELLTQYITSEDGATAIEYGLIAALIAISMITGVSTLGQKVNTNFQCANNVSQGVFRDDGVGACAQFEQAG